MYITESINSVDGFLQTLGPYLQLPSGNSFEISYTLRPGVIIKNGRATCWLQGNAQSTTNAVKLALKLLNATNEVIEAFNTFDNPYRTGVAVSCEGDKVVYRLYLHGQQGPGRKAIYTVWQWNANGQAIQRHYQFHFHSNVLNVAPIVQAVPGIFHDAFKLLADDHQFKKTFRLLVKG